jgi:hypothetical protein
MREGWVRAQGSRSQRSAISVQRSEKTSDQCLGLKGAPQKNGADFCFVAVSGATDLFDIRNQSFVA